MTEPRKDERRTTLWRRWRRDRRGAVAIEFAIVSIPFFAILFAILETALVFFMGQLLDAAVTSAARNIRTGAATRGGWNEARFRTEVCGEMMNLISCPQLYLRVQTFNAFSDITFTAPLNADDDFPDDGSYAASSANQIVAVTAYYQWPIIFDFLGMTLADLGNGRRLLAGATTFRNEPFP